MPTSTITDQVKAMLETAFSSRSWGNQLISSMGVEPRMLTDIAPQDDGIPPSDPTNVRTTSFLKSISVQWDAPAKDDIVVKAIIEVVPEGGTTWEEEVVQGNGYVFGDLDYVDHTFRVKFVDMWERESNWSLPSTAQPNQTADYKFDVERMRQLGNVGSFISIINQNLIDGENFAESTVRQISLAQPEYPNQLPLIEVDFDQWPAGTVWPPTDTDKDGNQYIHAQKPQGITASVVDINGKRWLKIIRGEQTTPDPSFYPFADFKRRQTEPGTRYIASVFVQGVPGTQVRFGVQASNDAVGTSLFELANTDVFTLGDEPKRLFVKFEMGASFPYIRFRLDTVGNNDTTYWTNFQLERADNKTEPSVWTPGVMSTGVVNARMLTAIDANIASAIFKNAAIDSAAIKDLTADKITAGLLKAGQIQVASTLELHGGAKDASGNVTIPPGKMIAGNTWLDSQGLSLLKQGSYAAPATLRASAITGRNDDGTPMASAIAFYDSNDPADPSNRFRGIVMRADGNFDNDGLIALHATNDGILSSTTTAKIELRAGKRGQNGQVAISRGLAVAENVTADDFKINGGTASLKDHKHDWSNDINNKPNFIKNNDDKVSLSFTSIKLDGHNLVIRDGYVKAGA